MLNNGKSSKAGGPAPAATQATKQTGAQTTSKYRGVCWNKKNKRWQSSINVCQKYVYLGSFTCEEDAARCYDHAALKTKGLPCKLNFPATDYFDENGQLRRDDNMDRVLAEAQAAAAKRVLDSLDDGGNSLSAGSQPGHIRFAIAVLKQHLLQQESSGAPGVAAAAPAAAASTSPAPPGPQADIAAAAAVPGNPVAGLLAYVPTWQQDGTAAAAVAAPDMDDDDMSLPGSLQAFASGSTLQQPWALQQQEQEQQQGLQDMLQWPLQGASLLGANLQDADVYVSAALQQEQVEAEMMRLHKQQQQTRAHHQQQQEADQQAVLSRQALLQPAQSEPSRGGCALLQWPAQPQQLMPSAAQEVPYEAPGSVAAAAAQQLRQDLQAMAGWLLQGASDDSPSPAASNHNGWPEGATMAPPTPPTAASRAPVMSSAIAAAAAAAGMPDSAALFQEAYRQTMGDALHERVNSVTSQVTAGCVTCTDGYLHCTSLQHLLAQLPEQSQVQHIISGDSSFLGIVYQRPCNAVRSGLLWGAALWDGNTIHLGSLYSSHVDAVRVCCFVLNVASCSSRPH